MPALVGADERRIRRLLIARGVGPDAHTTPPPPAHPPAAEPEQAEPDTGATEETAAQRHTLANRLPDWRSGRTIDLTKPEDQDEEQPADDEPDADDDQDDQPDTGDDTPDAEPDTGDTADTAPDKHPRAPRRPARTLGETLTGQDISFPVSIRLLAIAFNASAAATGYGLGLVTWLERLLPAAQTAAPGVLGAVLAVGGGWCAWRLSSTSAVRHVLPYPAISRIILTVAAAELGRRLAPAPVAWLTHHGAPYGLDPAATALLLTCGALSAALWWCCDRPARRWPPAVRWAARIPLASVFLAAALYAPGPGH